MNLYGKPAASAEAVHTESTDPGEAGTPLRILIPTETYAPEVNGAAKFAERLAHGLAGRGHEVHVVCPSDTGIPSDRDENGVRVHRIRSHRWMLHPSWTICLPWETKPIISRLLDDIAPDVVHTQAHFVIGRYAFSESRRRGIPVVATNHFMPENVRPYLKAPKFLLDAGTAAAWWDLRRKFESADAITVPTQLAADLLTVNDFTAPIQAISCGIDLTDFTSGDPVDHTVSGTPPTVLFVGRLSQEKRAADIVRAVAATDPALGLRARIVGAGDQLEPLRDLAADLGIAERVELTGKVDHAQLLQAFHECTMFCMPSTAELQSIATLEALASAKPVVLADSVALPHLVDHGVNGFLVTPGRHEEYAARFTEILTMTPEARQRMGQASRTLVARHDIETTISRFEHIYRSLL